MKPWQGPVRGRREGPVLPRPARLSTIIGRPNSFVLGASFPDALRRTELQCRNGGPKVWMTVVDLPRDIDAACGEASIAPPTPPTLNDPVTEAR